MGARPQRRRADAAASPAAQLTAAARAGEGDEAARVRSRARELQRRAASDGELLDLERTLLIRLFAEEERTGAEVGLTIERIMGELGVSERAARRMLRRLVRGYYVDVGPPALGTE